MPITRTQSYTTDGRLRHSADSLYCQHLFIWFGGMSRVCVCLQKYIYCFVTLYFSVFEKGHFLDIPYLLNDTRLDVAFF